MSPIPREFEWHLISADPESLLQNGTEIVEVNVADKKICITKWQEKLMAFQALCPHAGAPLKEGYIDSKGNVVCPLHHYKFCLSNGRNCTGQGYDMRIYPLEVRPEGLFLGIRKEGPK
ncbi:MAG: Rieske (2Fe-2S) protein [Chitinophagaceae bacterium]